MIMYKVTLTLRNDTDDDVMCFVPKGQVFENKNVGTQRQNLAAARDYRVIIPGRSRMTLELDALCTNQSMSGPNGSPGRTTVFRIAGSFDSQQDLWNIMSSAGLP
jgi:hypothetical protein